MYQLVHLGAVTEFARRPLTDKQRAIYEWIVHFFNLERCIPSYREIMEAFGFKSTNAVAVHLRAIEKKGYIQRPKTRRCRSMKVL